jgi:hypothetical protein
MEAAGKRRPLWGEQHRIEPRTKRNHWWANLGCLTSDDHFSRSPIAGRLGCCRIQGRGAIDPRPESGLPLIVIPTAPSVPSCSKLSRCGLTRAEYAARLGRRPTLTAPARAGFAILRVGAKKRSSRSNVAQVDRDDLQPSRYVPAPCPQMSSTPSQSPDPATLFHLGGGRSTATGSRFRHGFGTADSAKLAGNAALREFLSGLAREENKPD